MKQDLTQKQGRQGEVFIIHLLMRDKCDMPEKEYMTEIMRKHLGDVECFCHDEKTAGFSPKKYRVEFKEGAMPPNLMVTDCVSNDTLRLDELRLSQMWDCPESAEILSRCKYRVIATDMLASGMSANDRAEMLTDFAEALAEIYPQCEAVYFDLSGKMYTREKLLNCSVPKEQRFIYYAVNVRFFKIEGTQDMLIDSLGMNVLNMPDLQYHFHGMDPNWVVNHAYNALIYMLENDCPIKNGDTIDGIVNDAMSRQLQWVCRFEDSLIQPARPVIDINMGEYASGRRD